MLGLIEHALAAVVVQTVIGLTTRNWWIGAALASAYFLGREVAQAEYRWIAQYGDGLRANLPWWGVLDPRVWDTANRVADLVGPLAATGLLAVVMVRRQAKAQSR